MSHFCIRHIRSPDVAAEVRRDASAMAPVSFDMYSLRTLLARFENSPPVRLQVIELGEGRSLTTQAQRSGIDSSSKYGGCNITGVALAAGCFVSGVSRGG